MNLYDILLLTGYKKIILIAKLSFKLYLYIWYLYPYVFQTWYYL